EEKAVNDVGAPAQQQRAQPPQHREVEPRLLLVDDQLDRRARELGAARHVVVQGVDPDLVAARGELLRELDQLLLRAAERELADDVENLHRSFRPISRATSRTRPAATLSARR